LPFNNSKSENEILTLATERNGFLFLFNDKFLTSNDPKNVGRIDEYFISIPVRDSSLSMKFVRMWLIAPVSAECTGRIASTEKAIKPVKTRILKKISRVCAFNTGFS